MTKLELFELVNLHNLYAILSECLLIGCETENLSWTQKPPTRFVIETFQLILLRFVAVTSRI